MQAKQAVSAKQAKQGSVSNASKASKGSNASKASKGSNASKGSKAKKQSKANPQRNELWDANEISLNSALNLPGVKRSEVIQTKSRRFTCI